MRRKAIAVAAALGALLLLPAAASAQTCGQINRVADPPIHIPQPPGSVTSRMWIPPGVAATPKLEDVDINVDITHPDDIDLDISISHLGRTVTLSSGNGGSGEDYTRTVFDDEATESITAGSAPFTDSFKPEQALTAFDDMEPGGIWTLTVRDHTGITDSGGGSGTPAPQELNSWGIRWEANACSSVTPPCDEIVHRVGVPFSGALSSPATVSGTGSITRVEPRVTLTHPRDSDLHLSLKHGSTTVDLANHRGGSGANYTRTLFTDSAATAIAAGTAPFTGSFNPETPLSALNGAPPSGSWSFAVADDVSGMDGTFNEWSLRVVLDTCTDTDNDAVWAAIDNCPNAANPGQENYDRFKDGLGDACDDDDDQDGHPDTADACPRSPVPLGTSPDADSDADGCFDPEDADDDNDGVADASDSCPVQPVGADVDPDGDGCADAVDTDDDNDGVPDATDNCPAVMNAAQEDFDGDRIGDACDDPDDDDDGVLNAIDNCKSVANALQENGDRDLMGDACDVDDDADGLVDSADACRLLAARSLSGCPAFARKASFKFSSRRKLSGKLTVSGKKRAPACLARQRVALFRVKRGKDAAVGKPLKTSSKGAFALKKRLVRGKYYVVAKGATVRDVAECKAAKSKVVKRPGKA